MKVRMAPLVVLFVALYIVTLVAASPALAQSGSNETAQSAPAQHQPGAPAKPAEAPQMKTGTPASANAPAQALAEKLDPAKEAAIRHLMDITETSKLGDNLQIYITQQVHEVVGRVIAADRLQKFIDTFSAKFTASAPPNAFTDAVVPIYAKSFSMDDIQGLIHFYESPLGQRVVKTLPQISQESQQIGLEMSKSAALTVLRGMSTEYAEIKTILPPEDAKPADSAPASNPAPSSPPAPGTAKSPKPAPAPGTPAAPKPAPQN
ncbi:MAG: DUF2059 domain-containing protein [Candidatus Acidiferrales bacterium]